MIDYILASTYIQVSIKRIIIDEDRNCDRSDHNQMTIKVEKERNGNSRKKRTINKEYWDIKNEGKLERFARERREVQKER